MFIHFVLNSHPIRSTYVPVDIWCENDVVSTSMRRDHVASTLIQRNSGTKRPLGLYIPVKGNRIQAQIRDNKVRSVCTPPVQSEHLKTWTSVKNVNTSNFAQMRGPTDGYPQPARGSRYRFTQQCNFMNP